MSKEPLTPEQIEEYKKSIDGMTQYDMGRLQRFAPIGHPIFDSRNEGLYEYFQEKFKSLGGMTPGLSKELGFNNQ